MPEKLNLLNQISEELNKDLDLGKMLQRVIDLTVLHFKAASGSIMLFNHEGRITDYILQRKNVTLDQAEKIVGKVLTSGFAGWVLKNRRGDVIPDTEKDDRWYTYPNQPYTARSAMAAPLIRRGDILGILTINHTEPFRFTHDDLALISAIAGQAAIALENAQLFQQIEHDRAKLSAIINGTQDVILVTAEPDHTIVLMNPAAEQILQIQPGNGQNKQLTELTSLTKLINLFNTEPPAGGELDLPDGRIFLASTVQISAVGRMALLHDISALKALDKMKADFIATFTHDLAAPLAAIKGHIELLQMDGPLANRQIEDLGSIRMAVDQMRTLIKDLLELTRLESLKNLFKCDVVLEDTLTKTFTTFQPMATARHIELLLQADTKRIVTQGNPTLISRAIDNLVENALKYTMPHGKVVLSISNTDREVCITVKDTGIGISAANQPLVFNKFFRAHTPMENEIPGSGLGLAIVKTIVERHGGKVWVDSILNEGSTFTIALPVENGTP